MVFVTHDVAEAVFLADTISVMSARPGRIKQLVQAEFNRSDDPAIHKSPAFNDMVEQVWEMVRHEVDEARAKGLAAH